MNGVYVVVSDTIRTAEASTARASSRARPRSLSSSMTVGREAPGTPLIETGYSQESLRLGVGGRSLANPLFSVSGD